ncbi:hypothetical protein M4578_15525 [Salipiger sp. P9]|uniref:hypothetical protein n=1 Tax=Salipiger pentaromativorans TaxID=2943193 RepID=UPI002157A5AE|nr:hypothetical protein [Salipiger pentaromativorans]MCR8549248.1 hypothetical protein [Salipiger pentaromativorans]
MRIFVLILLAAFLTLVALPRSGVAMPMAGHMDHIHGCADCVEEVAAQDQGSVDHPECHHMASCAAATLPDDGSMAVTMKAARDGYPAPRSETGRAVSLGRDLPPPRL